MTTPSEYGMLIAQIKKLSGCIGRTQLALGTFTLLERISIIKGWEMELSKLIMTAPRTPAVPDYFCRRKTPSIVFNFLNGAALSASFGDHRGTIVQMA